jgi:hypothetical protein
MQITQLLSPNMFCINKIISADLIFEIFDIALLSWSRSLKAGGVDKRSVKATPFPSSFGLKSDERAAKRKEFLKKLEEKSNAKEVERTRLQSKSKEDKEVEIRKLRQSLKFKATPMPGFYGGSKTSKSTSDKEISKNEIHR